MVFLSFQPGEELPAALGDLALQDGRLVGGLGHTAGRVKRASLLESLPAAHGKKKLLGELHKSMTGRG